MAYKITDMISTIAKNGVLQTNKYLVLLTPPVGLQGADINGAGTGGTAALLQIRAEQAKLPGVLIQTSDINRYGVGPTQKMPYNVQFTDTSLTFIADRNGEIYRFFYSWMNTIFNFSGINGQNTQANYKVGYKDSYSTNMQIYVHDNYGNVIHIVSMMKAYPVSFNEISLGWANQNELMKLTIGITFRDWKLEDVSASIPAPQITPVLQNAPVLRQTLGGTAQLPTPSTLPAIGQNEINPATGKFNGILGTGSETPTFAPGA